MKIFLTSLLSLSFFVCFGQARLKGLDVAYEKNASDLLEQFLQTWAEEVKPITSTDALSDLEKDVYVIFKDFFTPFDWERFSKEGAEIFGLPRKSPYGSAKYIVVQTSVQTAVYDTDNLNYTPHKGPNGPLLAKRKVVNFRPDVKFDQAKTLFLSSEYKNLLLEFITAHHDYALSDSRLAFLNTKLHIVRGHWMGWHIESFPRVEILEFNRDSTLARVHFRLGYASGASILYTKNPEGKWGASGYASHIRIE